MTTSGTTVNTDGNWSQIVTSSRKHRPKTARPYAFTEQGVAMLSGILNSDVAINTNIAIMRAFVEIRRIVLQQGDIKEQLKAIQERIGEDDPSYPLFMMPLKTCLMIRRRNENGKTAKE